MSDIELSAKLEGWIDDNTVDDDFIAHPEFIYDKLLELEIKIQNLQAENAELKKKSEWISVDDELPELEERVLLKTQSGEIVTGWLRKLTKDDTYFCFGNEFAGWDYEFNYDLGAVTHFMPLPTPPKGE